MIVLGHETFQDKGQTLEAWRERLLAQLAIIGRLDVVVAIGNGQFQPLDNGIGHIHLPGVGMGLAVQVVDEGNQRIAVHVDDHLVQEVGIMVLGIDLQHFAPQRNVPRGAGR